MFGAITGAKTLHQKVAQSKSITIGLHILLVTLVLCTWATISSAYSSSSPFLVKDINSATAKTSSNAKDFIELGQVTIFTASDGLNGQELWKTDGTEAGTVLLKDINSG